LFAALIFVPVCYQKYSKAIKACIAKKGDGCKIFESDNCSTFES